MDLKYLLQKIYDYEPSIYFNIKDLVYHKNIRIPGKYIITKNIDGLEKKQVVNIDYKYINKDGTSLYEYNYGIFGFHEGYAKLEQISFLNKEQLEKFRNGQYWSLPQQFYQSFPT